MQRSELCRSLAGNICPLITITNPSSQPHALRPAVVFTGQRLTTAWLPDVALALPDRARVLGHLASPSLNSYW